jgi:hypothetical protein
MFKQYRKISIGELRPYVYGEPMEGIMVSDEDKKTGSPQQGDMIARNPKNHKDQWLISEAYFRANFEEVK